jgi:hypothetical protein
MPGTADAPEAGVVSNGVGVGAGAPEFVAGTCDGGLTPPTPSSVEPDGIPARPLAVDAESLVAGEDADAAGLPEGAAPMLAHVPDAVAAAPPPSKSELGVLRNALGVPPLELRAADAAPEHVPLLLLMGALTDDIPAGPGLIPMDPSPDEPSGTPVPDTAAGPTGVMPSGVVVGNGDGVFVTWAHAGPHIRNAAIAPINMRVVMTASLGGSPAST